MDLCGNDTDERELELIRRAGCDDSQARQQLLARHRMRLRRMVALRLDRRMSARVDPSDVVQEALIEAGPHLEDYLREPVVPFYTWLRRFAWERVIQLHRFHLDARRRSVERESTPIQPSSSPESAVGWADRLLDPGTSPSRHLLRDERRQQVRDLLCRLGPLDREILLLRYLEGMTTREAATTLQITEGAAKVRLLRALDRFQGLLGDDTWGELP